MLVGVSDALVIFLAILVFVGVGIGIAPPPKLLDKALALIVGLELLEGLPLFIGDDVSDILFQPILVSLIQFGLDIASLLRWILGLFAVLFCARPAGTAKMRVKRATAKRPDLRFDIANYSSESIRKI